MNRKQKRQRKRTRRKRQIRRKKKRLLAQKAARRILEPELIIGFDGDAAFESLRKYFEKWLADPMSKQRIQEDIRKYEDARRYKEIW